jgi:hypothetical protein
LQIKSSESLRLLRESVDKKAWGTSPPTVVNAFYTPSRNQISKKGKFNPYRDISLDIQVFLLVFFKRHFLIKMHRGISIMVVSITNKQML